MRVQTQMKVKIAQIQLMVQENLEDSIRNIEQLANQIDNDVDFIMFPEMFACPYKTSNFPVYAEKQGEKIFRACSNLAKHTKKYLIAGSMPELDEGNIYNTSYVFDRNGELIAKHRKVHLFDIDVKNGQRFKESDTLSAGDKITVFDTEYGKCGLCICYDYRFPEMGRRMALAGAKMIFVPAAFNMTTGPAHWELMFRSQSLNNQVFSVGTSPARDEGYSYVAYGHSIVTNPWGEIVGQMDEKEGIQVTEIELDEVEEIREQLPLLRHRRSEIYHKMCTAQ